MNEITKAPMPLGYADLERLATSIAHSGLFGIKTKDQAIALMMIAHAEGSHPALAARDYDVIQGKPAKKAEAMMRDFIGAGGKVEWHTLSDSLADATFTHPQTGSVRIDWNIERARVAGFAGKDNWRKFPRAMLRSRVVSEGVRTIWPLATSGMYVPEEVRDFAGPTIEDSVIDTPEPAPAPEPERPEYHFATKSGGVIYHSSSEFVERWRLLVSDCTRRGQLDKLAVARQLNDKQLQAIGEFDPDAAREVLEMTDEHLQAATDTADPNADSIEMELPY